ncbi:hypothetical protein BGZ58_004856 [Dissophora ornata]|nr:hypothetical protein BGZ58_004856 [Dissophora ornata]
MTNPTKSFARLLFGQKPVSAATTTATVTHTKPGTGAAPTYSALVIVEILELIFSNLPAASLFQASLVCKKWYRVSQRSTVHYTYWSDTSQTICNIVDRIYVKRVLYCRFLHYLKYISGSGDYTTQPETDEKWKRLLEQLPKRKAPDSRQGPIEGIIRPCLPALTSPIRNLYLSGYIHSEKLSSILPSILLTLTKLDIRFQQPQTIDLLEILQCPRLTCLYIERCSITTFFKPQLNEKEGDGKSAQSRSEPGQIETVPQSSPLNFSLPLQSFTLASVEFDQPSLECLFEHSSDMREFKVIYTAKVGQTIAEPYNESELLRHLGTHCPKVDTVQLSQLDHQSSNSRLSMMLEELPKFRSVGIHTAEFTPRFSEAFIAHSCRITTLSITQGPSDLDDKLLHKFLCFCPTLLHLHAYDVFMDIQNLDSATSSGTLEDSALSAAASNERLWACRDLKTLQLSFKSSNWDIPPQQRQHKVLAYIPKVCPHLEHLQLDLFAIDLSSKGGLSLLATSGSGLPRLETLGLGTCVIREAKKGDVKWMYKQPPSLLQKGLNILSTVNSSGVRVSVNGSAVAEEKMPDYGDIWPRWIKLRLYYELLSKETIEKVKRLQKLVASVRPGLDFKVIDNPSKDLELW